MYLGGLDHRRFPPAPARPPLMSPAIQIGRCQGVVEMDNVKLVLGDCLDVMSGIAGHSVDLILVDPPHARTNCRWDCMIPFEPLWEHYQRILKPDGTAVVISTHPFTSRL